MEALPVLCQFTASHYNEKARWGLDWKGIPHVRRSLLPGLHFLPILRLTGQKSVPVLVVDGKATADSTRILDELDRIRPEPPLLPADPEGRRRALELEEHFDTELGPHIRRAVFYEILPDADFCSSLFSQDAGALARRAYRTFFPAVRVAMRLDMGIDASSAARSRDKMAAALDRLEKEIAPDGYLVGGRFTRADLTAAALFSPLVQPPEFPYAWRPHESVMRLRESFAGRPGFRWVQETYRRHRGTSHARPAPP